MVNNKNISAYTKGSPPVGGSNRTIEIGPIYPRPEVLSVLDNSDEPIVVWTKKCGEDIQDLMFDVDKVKQLIKSAVTKGNYHNSEWCKQSPGGPWAACDSYTLEIQQFNEVLEEMITNEYFIKFAIGKTGKILLLVSCHPPK